MASNRFPAFWRWKSRKPGRPALAQNIRELILRDGTGESNLG